MDFISDVDTSNTQDDKSGDNDCHVYHVDGRIDLQSCYKRKDYVICRLSEEEWIPAAKNLVK